MLNPHDATLHHEKKTVLAYLDCSFNTDCGGTVSCSMVQCCIVWIYLNSLLVMVDIFFVKTMPKATLLNAIIEKKVTIKFNIAVTFAMFSI